MDEPIATISFDIDLTDITNFIVSIFNDVIVDTLKRINIDFGNQSLSFWVVLIGFFIIDVVIYVLFTGDSVKSDSDSDDKGGRKRYTDYYD